MTELRCTALPTPLPTTNPTRTGSRSSRIRACTTRDVEPARDPRRTTSPNSADRRSRCARGSTVVIRQQAGRGPCAGGRPRWRDRHECACAGGSRASCADGGCSAGTYAWSRVKTPSSALMVCVDGLRRPSGLRGNRSRPSASSSTAPPHRTLRTSGPVCCGGRRCGVVWTCGDPRLRPTHQRYASDPRRVKPAQATRQIRHAPRGNPLVSRCEPPTSLRHAVPTRGRRSNLSLTCGQRVEIESRGLLASRRTDAHTFDAFPAAPGASARRFTGFCTACG